MCGYRGKQFDSSGRSSTFNYVQKAYLLNTAVTVGNTMHSTTLVERQSLPLSKE